MIRAPPLAIECTFTSSKVGEDLASALPGDLDMPNNVQKEDYRLIFHDHSKRIGSVIASEAKRSRGT
jgi:hypothetical protein